VDNTSSTKKSKKAPWENLPPKSAIVGEDVLARENEVSGDVPVAEVDGEFEATGDDREGVQVRAWAEILECSIVITALLARDHGLRRVHGGTHPQRIDPS
jgi:hypothetical protein